MSKKDIENITFSPINDIIKHQQRMANMLQGGSAIARMYEASTIWQRLDSLRFYEMASNFTKYASLAQNTALAGIGQPMNFNNYSIATFSSPLYAQVLTSTQILSVKEYIHSQQWLSNIVALNPEIQALSQNLKGLINKDSISRWYEAPPSPDTTDTTIKEIFDNIDNPTLYEDFQKHIEPDLKQLNALPKEEKENFILNISIQIEAHIKEWLDTLDEISGFSDMNATRNTKRVTTIAEILGALAIAQATFVTPEWHSFIQEITIKLTFLLSFYRIKVILAKEDK